MATGKSDVAVPKMMSAKRGGKSDKDRPRFLARHRMHRSSVRPFFCCGSQLSLNSIPELKDVTVTANVDDDYEDLSDSEDIDDDDNIIVELPSTSKCEKTTQKHSRFQNTKRKKGVSLLDKPCTRKKFWSMKLRGKLQLSKQSHCVSESELSMAVKDNTDCVCTSYRHSIPGAEGGQNVPHRANIGVPVTAMAHLQLAASNSMPFPSGHIPIHENVEVHNIPRNNCINAPLPFISNLNTLYPINDIDEQLIAQRRYEMEHGVDLGENAEVWIHQSDERANNGSNDLVTEPRAVGQYPTYGAMGLLSSDSDNLVNSPVPAISLMNNIPCSTMGFSLNPWLQLSPQPPSGVHTQVDYKHHLVPHLDAIINSSFYWGVMNRYEAEKLIENKAEGTFLLRDSAQDEFLFSVSFRRYGRSLHARIEQWNHKFSFDSRDPGVFATNSVCGLIEHYKDPSRCMFFEPMLTLPMHRNFPFSLQHITRAVICKNITYNDINQLTLPASLKEYLRFYHYKQKIRVRRFDNI
ncbi:hypothetical protein ACF0H5_001967 [Mactra antiquata]